MKIMPEKQSLLAHTHNNVTSEYNYIRIKQLNIPSIRTISEPIKT